MATLLHLDSSLFPTVGSTSRTVTGAFREVWEARHPHSSVVYRDLAADPVPHLDSVAASAGFADPSTHTAEQATAFAARLALVEELERADAVLIGAPMYNFSIPSTLKAWLDQVILPGRTAGPASTLKGKPVTVVASRGGSYAPGTPRESFEYVQNYLGDLLSEMLSLDVDFIVPELTLARTNPAMAELIPLADASREKALEDANTKAKSLADRLVSSAA
ncbi:FMN-dependent NADH-azoreductase [Streptomyces sp. SID4919]|uniref:FMN-dependent NADH-azoreductase n=1 Tax=unclassified Streptomyces TaxID=2593676 RepID=UPI0008238A38|nr:MULTISPECIES: NAD(P)H-dependent oxidoreductase [unclassified Streptomyces]MYY13089.1 FMN-dependent NADH-azoreductase [Streptomyces sp. SID4919]SCK37545.1 FMN-dependent NADH-azoreductase [Streptomyces sp. AmelKG-E11A]